MCRQPSRNPRHSSLSSHPRQMRAWQSQVREPERVWKEAFSWRLLPTRGYSGEEKTRREGDGSGVGSGPTGSTGNTGGRHRGLTRRLAKDKPRPCRSGSGNKRQTQRKAQHRRQACSRNSSTRPDHPYGGRLSRRLVVRNLEIDRGNLGRHESAAAPLLTHLGKRNRVEVEARTNEWQAIA